MPDTNEPPIPQPDPPPETTRPPTPSSDSPPECSIALTPEEYKFHIDLYKFCLEFSFKAITIFFTVVGGVLAFGLRTGQEPNEISVPFKRMLLVTSFLMSLAMIVGFGLSTVMWVSLWRQVKREMNWWSLLWSCLSRKDVCASDKSNLAVGIYSPSLTLILFITMILFIVFSILLGKLMAHYNVWFCPRCWLG
jgi:hypothetical protein